jgi:hypothetical protein
MRSTAERLNKSGLDHGDCHVDVVARCFGLAGIRLRILETGVDNEKTALDDSDRRNADVGRVFEFERSSEGSCSPG